MTDERLIEIFEAVDEHPLWQHRQFAVLFGRALLAEVEPQLDTLRGQRDVLCRLLGEAAGVLDTLPIDGTCESVLMETLLRDIKAACQAIAAEQLESTHG